MSDEKKSVIKTDVPSDHIDIYGEIDASVKKLASKNEQQLNVSIFGNNIDYSIVNAIRRTILMSIPIYAFHRSNIHIEVEKSYNMYNNDLIYNQIETLPIFDLPNYFDLEDPEIFLPTEVMKKLFGSFIQEKYTDEESTEQNNNIKIQDAEKKLMKIELSISIKNHGNSDKFVSTHDAVLKVNGKVANSYQIREPISILVLKPTEEIYLRAEANLGISKMNAIYEATTNAIHKEITPTKYELVYETLEQLDKNIIFSKACSILVKKLQYLRNFIENKYPERDSSEKIEIQLYGEEHTLGNMYATTLQKCDDVRIAAYVMPHLFTDHVIISYQLQEKSKKKPIAVFLDVTDYLIKLFQQINDSFNATSSTSKSSKKNK